MSRPYSHGIWDLRVFSVKGFRSPVLLSNDPATCEFSWVLSRPTCIVCLSSSYLPLCRNTRYHHSGSDHPEAATTGSAGVMGSFGSQPSDSTNPGTSSCLLGPHGLSVDLASSAFGTEESAVRADFLSTTRRGMTASFLRGQTVCGSSASVADIVCMTLCE